jgi:hypothetical protein
LRAVRVFRRVNERACPIRVSSRISFPDLFSDIFPRFTHVEECARVVSNTDEVVQIGRLNSVLTEPFQVSASAAGQGERREDRNDE